MRLAVEQRGAAHLHDLAAIGFALGGFRAGLAVLLPRHAGFCRAVARLRRPVADRALAAGRGRQIVTAMDRPVDAREARTNRTGAGRRPAPGMDAHCRGAVFRGRTVGVGDAGQGAPQVVRGGRSDHLTGARRARARTCALFVEPRLDGHERVPAASHGGGSQRDRRDCR